MFTLTWEARYEALVKAYLRWKYPQAPQGDTDTDGMYDSSLDQIIPTVDLYTLETEVTVRRQEADFTVINLARLGYLANSPTMPSIAISFKTLELYCRIRQRKASFSFEAFAKVLCDLYQVCCIIYLNHTETGLMAQKPYCRQWRIALSDAFDVYLTIQRRVSSGINQALGRLTDHWRVLNACPPCTYQVRIKFHYLTLLTRFHSLRMKNRSPGGF